MKYAPFCSITFCYFVSILIGHFQRTPISFMAKLEQMILTSSSWGVFFTSKVIRHSQDEVVITWYQVRTIRWKHKNRLTKLLKLLASVWPSIVLTHNSNFRRGNIYWDSSLAECRFLLIFVCTFTYSPAISAYYPTYA